MAIEKTIIEQVMPYLNFLPVFGTYFVAAGFTPSFAPVSSFGSGVSLRKQLQQQSQWQQSKVVDLELRLNPDKSFGC